MSTAEKIVLKRAGEAITIVVVSCTKVPQGRYPEWEFVGQTEDGGLVSIAIPEKSVVRQLERIQLTVQSCVGQTLTISRDPNNADPSKPFWGINLGDDAIHVAAPAARTAPVPARAVSAATGTVGSAGAAQTNGHAPGLCANCDKSSVLYQRITQYALDKIVPMYHAAGIPVTMEGTHAVVATLYITARDAH